MIPKDNCLNPTEVRPIAQQATSQLEYRIVAYLTPAGVLLTGPLGLDAAARFAGSAMLRITEETAEVAELAQDMQAFLGDRLILAVGDSRSELEFDDGSVEVLEWARKRATAGWRVYRMINFFGDRLYPHDLRLPDDTAELYTVIGWAQGEVLAAVYERVTADDRELSVKRADMYLGHGRFPFGTVRGYAESVADPLDAMRALVAYRLITHNILKQETYGGPRAS